jgi:hypothetical protein
MNGKKRRGRPKGPTPPKRQYPLKLDEETRGQLAAAAYWTRRSANSIIEEGIAVVLRRLQQEHNGGKPFPPRPATSAPAGAGGVPEGVAGDGGRRPAPAGKPERQRGGQGAKKGQEKG